MNAWQNKTSGVSSRDKIPGEAANWPIWHPLSFVSTITLSPLTECEHTVLPQITTNEKYGNRNMYFHYSFTCRPLFKLQAILRQVSISISIQRSSNSSLSLSQMSDLLSVSLRLSPWVDNSFQLLVIGTLSFSGLQWPLLYLLIFDDGQTCILHWTPLSLLQMKYFGSLFFLSPFVNWIVGTDSFIFPPISFEIFSFGVIWFGTRMVWMTVIITATCISFSSKTWCRAQS